VVLVLQSPLPFNRLSELQVLPFRVVLQLPQLQVVQDLVALEVQVFLSVQQVAQLVLLGLLQVVLEVP